MNFLLANEYEFIEGLEADHFSKTKLPLHKVSYKVEAHIHTHAHKYTRSGKAHGTAH